MEDGPITKAARAFGAFGDLARRVEVGVDHALGPSKSVEVTMREETYLDEDGVARKRFVVDDAGPPKLWPETWKPAGLEMTREDYILEVVWLLVSVCAEEYDRSLPGSFNRHGEWIPRGDVAGDSRRRARLLEERGLRVTRLLGAGVGKGIRRLFDKTLPKHEERVARLETLQAMPRWAEVAAAWVAVAGEPRTAIL